MRSRPRWLRTVAVWLVALLLTAGWWSLRGASAGRGQTGTTAVAVFAGSDAIPLESIDLIRLARRDEPELVLRRVDGHWRQMAPFEVDLDDWSARQLVEDAAALVSARSVAKDAGDANALGFAPPTATLTLEGGGRTWTLEFGKRGVAGRAFARRSGGPIAVVEGPLYERAVEADPREWRSRQLFPDVLGRPKRFVFARPDAGFEVERKGERWAIVAPQKTRAEQQRMEDLTAALARARCDGFLADAPDDLAMFGLATPAARLTVTFQTEVGEATRTLLVGAVLGVGTADRYAQIEGTATVMRLSAGTIAALFPGEVALLEQTGSGARPADVKRIEVRPIAGDAFELVRDLDHWTAARIVNGKAGPALPCNSGLPERLLKSLCVDRATEAGYGTLPEGAKVADVLLYGFDSKLLDVVRIGKDTNTGRWGLENGDAFTRIFAPTTKYAISADDYGLPK